MTISIASKINSFSLKSISHVRKYIALLEIILGANTAIAFIGRVSFDEGTKPGRTATVPLVHRCSSYFLAVHNCHLLYELERLN